MRNTDDQNIIKLFDYIFKDKIDKLFSEEFAYQVLTSEKDFEDLHHYLQECYNCLRANLEFAGVILIRSCIEKFLSLYNKNPNDRAIDNFIKKIDEDDSLKNF